MKKAVLFIFIFTLQSFSMDLLSNPLDLSNQNIQQKNKEKFSYKDMIEYLKTVDDPKQMMILGMLYANGSNKKDDNGETLEQDIFQADKYLRKSASLGNYYALAILGGLVLYNENMRRLDPELKQTLKDLTFAYNKGVLEAGILLTVTLFEKKKWDEGLKILIDSSNKNDSVAQLQLALIFKQGLKDGNDKANKEWIVKPNEKVALFYLNKACSNEKKNKKVKEFCFNKENTIIERR